MAAAEIAKSRVLCLLLVILERFKKRFVLHYRVVDLAFKEVDSGFHFWMLHQCCGDRWRTSWAMICGAGELRANNAAW
jgi:hypothetical protein